MRIIEGRTSAGGAGTTDGRAAQTPRLERPGAVEAFAGELGDLWSYLEAWCTPASEDDIADLSRRLEQHMIDHPTCRDKVGELANDLMALMAGWQHFGAGERAVVTAAMTYLVEAEDAIPDDAPGGLEDDDRVVGAAVRAVLRPRRPAREGA